MLKRLAHAITGLARVNLRFVRSSAFRATTMKALSRPHVGSGPSAVSLRERATAPALAQPYAELSGAALALARIRVTEAPARLNLVLGELDPAALFAGVDTALEVGWSMARRLGLELRVVTLNERLDVARAADVETYLAGRFGTPVSVVPRTCIGEAEYTADDVWLVTHWTTAHPAQVAAIVGVIDARRVVYLIQDFEPGFHGWSTQHALARGTYDAGFHHLVNSAPLAAYLGQEGVPVVATFAPALDENRLRSVAESRTSARRRVLFYGRPGKPRNMFELGIAALRHAVMQLGTEADDIEFISAGEAHSDVDLGRGVILRSLGALARDDYFDELASCGVVLSLQASPHPSHPPLEAAISGAIAVSNEFENTRAHLHERLWAVPADAVALGDALARAVRLDRDRGTASYHPVGAALGSGLTDAVDLVCSLL